MKLAIFGGTFDPIHRAHLEIARKAADQFTLDRVLLVPAAHPPHKAGVAYTAFTHRVRMCELACKGEPWIEVSRIEEKTSRSYSIDTIEKVRAGLAPADELFFLIGADAFSEIQSWHRWRDVVRAVTFIVVSRPGAIYTAPAGVHPLRIDNLEFPISSSQIRHALASGARPPEVPEAVLEYILQNGLYGTKSL
jgi:nicotinate-nucleotide adenylyltransferase